MVTPAIERPKRRSPQGVTISDDDRRRAALTARIQTIEQQIPGETTLPRPRPQVAVAQPRPAAPADVSLARVATGQGIPKEDVAEAELLQRARQRVETMRQRVPAVDPAYLETLSPDERESMELFTELERRGGGIPTASGIIGAKGAGAAREYTLADRNRELREHLARLGTAESQAIKEELLKPTTGSVATALGMALYPEWTLIAEAGAMTAAAATGFISDPEAFRIAYGQAEGSGGVFDPLTRGSEAGFAVAPEGAAIASLAGGLAAGAPGATKALTLAAGRGAFNLSKLTGQAAAATPGAVARAARGAGPAAAVPSLAGMPAAAQQAVRTGVQRLYLDQARQLILDPGAFDEVAGQMKGNAGQRAGRAMWVFQQAGQRKAGLATDRVLALGKQTDRWVFGKHNAAGAIQSGGKLDGLFVNDIRANPAKYEKVLTPMQTAWVRWMNALDRAKTELLLRNGIDVHELPLEQGGEYAGRRMVARILKNGDVVDSAYVGPGGSTGGRSAFQKTRRFNTMAEAAAEGFVPMAEHEALTLNIRGAYNTLATQQMAGWLVAKGVLRTANVDKTILKAARDSARYKDAVVDFTESLKHAKRGENLPWQKIAKMGRTLPVLATELDNALAITPTEFDKALRQVQGHILKGIGTTREQIITDVNEMRLAKVRGAKPGRTPAATDLRVQQTALLEEQLNPGGNIARRAQARAGELSAEAGRLGGSQLPYAADLAPGQRGLLSGRSITPGELTGVAGRLTKDNDAVVRFVASVYRSAHKTANVYRTRAIDDLIVKGERFIRPARTQAKIALHEAARAKEIARQPHFGEKALHVPAFAGKVFTGPDALKIEQSLARYMQDPGFTGPLGKGIEVISSVNRLARFLWLTGDVSIGSIQLLILGGMALTGKPAAARAYGGALRSMAEGFADPQTRARFLATPENAAFLKRNPWVILTSGGATEATDFMAQSGFLGSAKLQKGISAPLRRFANMTEFGLDYAGISMGKALEPLVKTQADRYAMNEYVNKVRGLADLKLFGASRQTRQLATLFALAPNYNAAIAGLLIDASRGGLRGTLARESLARFTGGMVALNMAITASSGALDGKGEEEIWEDIVDHINPNSGRFFTWKVAGQNIGPGSKVRSVVKFVSQVAGDPGSLAETEDLMDNPAWRFARAQASPSASIIEDIRSGRTYTGEQVRANNPVEISREVLGEHAMPQFVGAMLFDGGSLGERVTRGIAAFGGLREYELSPQEKFNAWTEEQEPLREDFGSDEAYQEANRRFQLGGVPRELMPQTMLNRLKETPEGKALSEEAEADSRRRDQTAKAFQQWEVSREKLDLRLAEQASAADGGQQTFFKLREDYQDYGLRLSQTWESLELDPRYAATLREWKETDADLPEDIAYQMYLRVIHDPALDDPVAGFDYDRQEAAIGALQDELGPEMWANVLRRREQEVHDLPQAIQDWVIRDRIKLREYWDVPRELAGDRIHLWNAYKDWQKASAQDKEQLVRSNRALARLIDRAEIARKRLRLRNPEIDRLLAKWYGQSYKPRTRRRPAQ